MYKHPQYVSKMLKRHSGCDKNIMFIDPCVKLQTFWYEFINRFLVFVKEALLYLELKGKWTVRSLLATSQSTGCALPWPVSSSSSPSSWSVWEAARIHELQFKTGIILLFAVPAGILIKSFLQMLPSAVESWVSFIYGKFLFCTIVLLCLGSLA